MSQKSTSPIDRHIGQRVRTRRIAIGLSQERLGELLGITFQQVQKYEKGVNRIAAGRLHGIAQVLGVDMPFFFDGFGERPGSRSNSATAPVEALLSDRDGIELAKAFLAIRNPTMRRAIVELARATASNCGAGAPS